MTARMRTITEAIAAIKAADPQTAFTQTALRRMIRSGEIKSVKVGCKYLVNLDTLLDYLADPVSGNTKILEVSGIRRIPEKVTRGIKTV